MPAQSPPLDLLREANHDLRRVVLDNGMVLLIKQDRSAPVVAIQIWVGVGSIHEGDYLGAGMAHYLEHMIFKGTTTRGPGEISRTIDDAGGRINAYTAHDRTVFYCDLPAHNWHIGLDVLTDAVMNASLPEDEWKREIDVILREFAMGYDSPPRVHSKLLWETAFRVHPYRHPVIGYEDIFRTINRDHLFDFINRHYTPDNMITVVVGDIDPDDVEAFLRNAYADFARRKRPPVVLPSEPPQQSPRLARATGPYQISRLHMAYHTVPLGHPDVPALDILADILGQGRSSRLYQRFRDDLHLVHSISAWSHNPQYAGLFGIHAVFDPQREDELIPLLIEKIASLHETDFTHEEIEKARRNQLVHQLSSLQTMSGRASSFGAGEYYTGDPRFAETYLQQLSHVTAADLQRVARAYLREPNRTLALLTPPPPAPEASAPTSSLDLSIHRLELENGTPLIVREDNRLPFVHVALVLGGGLLSETEEQAGITQLMADLLTRGTLHRSAAEIAHQTESRGATFTSFSGRNTFGLLGTSLTEDAPFLIDLMLESLREPAFDTASIERQRAAQIAAVRQQAEQPMTVAQEVLRNALFPGHPYRWTTAGREPALASITRDDLLHYAQQHLLAGNLSIAVFGNITPDHARDLVAPSLRDLPSGTLARTPRNFPPP
ncbi:MAG TPA: pitrilysin family protein, partial [Kiritimatiellia bacterium]|nr:pitrilysin family protein [Kiritimatiellia bacterium]